jgi:hypothetical protein
LESSRSGGDEQAILQGVTAAGVVILSSGSLFAEGVARRLSEYLDPTNLDVLDPRNPDTMSLINAARPSFVILDATDSQVSELCPLDRLLFSVPELRVLCLDPQKNLLHVVTGEEREVAEVRDLADVILQCIPSRASTDEG